MILTDDNFSTIVKAVEVGRGLYDNLARYVRFQIGGLFGYIITFLGASIFNVAKGIPLLPLQTLWVSFTMLSIQSVGLGYSKPAAGLMERPPLPPTQPILTRGLIVWLACGRPGDDDRHPQRDQLGGARARARHRPDHGHGHVRAVPSVLLDRVERPAGLGVLPRHLLRQDVRRHDRRRPSSCSSCPPSWHLPDGPEDRHARRPAVADLRRRGPVDRGGRRAAGRRCCGGPSARSGYCWARSGAVRRRAESVHDAVLARPGRGAGRAPDPARPRHRRPAGHDRSRAAGPGGPPGGPGLPGPQRPARCAVPGRLGGDAGGRVRRRARGVRFGLADRRPRAGGRYWPAAPPPGRCQSW